MKYFLSFMDPKRIARGGPTLTTFSFFKVDEGIQIPLKTAVINPPVKHRYHLNGVSLTADRGPTLNTGLTVGIWTSIGKKPYSLGFSRRLPTP